MRRGDEGFTLVELLIALAILALLAVLGYRAVASLGDTESRLAAEAEHWRTLDALFSRLEGDCREAVARDVRSGDTVEPAWIGTIDGDGNAVLRLSRAGPELVVEPGGGGQRIAYRVRNRTLEVLYWPALDMPAGATPYAYPLAANVASLTLAYLDSKNVWRDHWPIFGEAAVPRGVRVTLQIASGEQFERWLALR